MNPNLFRAPLDLPHPVEIPPLKIWTIRDNAAGSPPLVLLDETGLGRAVGERPGALALLAIDHFKADRVRAEYDQAAADQRFSGARP